MPPHIFHVLTKWLRAPITSYTSRNNSVFIFFALSHGRFSPQLISEISQTGNNRFIFIQLRFRREHFINVSDFAVNVCLLKSEHISS